MFSGTTQYHKGTPLSTNVAKSKLKKTTLPEIKCDFTNTLLQIKRQRFNLLVEGNKFDLSRDWQYYMELLLYGWCFKLT